MTSFKLSYKVLWYHLCIIGNNIKWLLTIVSLIISMCTTNLWSSILSYFIRYLCVIGCFPFQLCHPLRCVKWLVSWRSKKYICTNVHFWLSLTPLPSIAVWYYVHGLLFEQPLILMQQQIERWPENQIPHTKHCKLFNLKSAPYL